jgi:metacaspase-1
MNLYNKLHQEEKFLNMIRLISVLCLAGCILSIQVKAQQKKALLIGIGTYPRENGWKSLSSINDIHYLQSILKIKGFTEKDIALLLNEQATFSGIEKAMQNLIAQTKSGDIIMLHFSGHGQQITDDNGDEADGYDEAWIPYDAGSRFDPTGYRGEKHLRDDVVGAWVTALSQKVGSKGSVFVSIDACHSGTATRSQELGIVRGDPSPFKIPGKKKALFGQETKSSSEFLSSEAVEKGNVVVFSASSPTQVNYETKDANEQGVGSLTYAFAKSISELPAGATYAELFYRVKAKIQAWIPVQLPMTEGDGSQLLFAGAYKAADDVMYVDRWANDSMFTVKLGSLQQLAEGAELLLIDPATNKQVATAIAARVSLVETIALVQTPLEKTKPYVVKVKSLPAMPYKLSIGYRAQDVPKSWIPLLDNYIKEYGFTTKSDNPDCWITFVQDTGLVVVTKENDMTYLDASAKTGKLSNEAMKALKQPLQDIAKSNFMRNLPDGGSLAGQVVWQVVAKDGKKASEHELTFTNGDRFDILLKNNSSKPIYFALINIMPGGKIEVLLPDATSAAEDFSLQPRESFPITDNTITGDTPEGREFLRVMVSHTPFDIRPVFNKQAKKRGGNLTSWEEAIGDIMQQEGSVIPKKRSVQVNEITLLTQSFMVKK